MRTHRPLIALTAVALLAAGCGSSSSSSSSKSSTTSTTTAKPAAVAGTKVTIKSFKFKPPALSVKVGQKVTFTNLDSSNHTATANTSGFDTGNLQQGKSKTITFSKAGTFAYHCDFHPFMKGTIVVR